MKIIEPSVELVDDFDAAAVMRKIERAGRVCYKSEENIKPESAEKFIRGIIKRGHESVIEHATVSFKIVCDRGVTHELVRHRIASYSQESTRYCVAGDMKLSTVNPHFNMTVKDFFDNVQKSQNGSWKRILIKQLNESTGVLEYALVKNIFMTGIKKIFQITTDLGYKLQCTADHEIYTPRGYAKLSELNAGDKIYVNGVNVDSNRLYQNRDWLYHQNITLNKTFVAIAEEFGFNVSTLKKWARKFNLPKKGTGYFNAGRIPWNKGLSEFDDNRVKNLTNALRIYHCNGRHDGEKIILKRDTSEYQKYTAEKCAICGSVKSLQVHHKDEDRTNHQPENLITLCSSCHLRVHSKNLEIIFADEIKSIEYIGEAEVYDIEMNSPFHNFVANGVVVHNCDYSAGKFGGELTFIKPCFWSDDDENFHTWLATMELIERNYLALRAKGAKPEQARSILPNSLKTEIFVTMNLRELRHFLKLRTDKAAHPQMRQIALKMLDILVEKLPAVFADIKA